MDSAKKLIEKYYSWLQDKTFFKRFWGMDRNYYSIFRSPQ